MKHVKGDLIQRAKDGEFNVIIHGCNCFNTMGAGIAPQIAKAFPSAYNADQVTILGDKTKLGTISIGFEQHLGLFVINAYTQFDYKGKKPIDYAALQRSFAQIKTLFSGKKIGYPAIGCGLAGGNWDIVSKLIDVTLTDDVDHTFVEWDQ